LWIFTIPIWFFPLRNPAHSPGLKINVLLIISFLYLWVWPWKIKSDVSNKSSFINSGWCTTQILLFFKLKKNGSLFRSQSNSFEASSKFIFSKMSLFPKTPINLQFNFLKANKDLGKVISPVWMTKSTFLSLNILHILEIFLRLLWVSPTIPTLNYDVFSRIWIPQAVPRPITWVMPILAPSTCLLPASPLKWVQIS